MRTIEQARFTGGDWDGRLEWIGESRNGIVHVYAPPNVQSYKITRVNGRQVARYIPGSTRPAKRWLNREE